MEFEAEFTPEILDERIDQDAFFGEPGVVLDIQHASALCHAEMDPVSGFITRSFEARYFDKGLDQHRAVSVAPLPVHCDSTRRHSKQ